MGNNKYVCPFGMDSMKVTGHIGSERFDYVKLSLDGCNLGAECFSDLEIVNQDFDFSTIKTWPNLISDDIDDVVTSTPDFSYYK